MKQSIYLLNFCILLFTSSYSQPGTLDSRFAENGIFFDTSIKVYCNTAFLQKEGKILVGGFTDDLNMDFFLMRLNNSGYIDSSFGINGKTIVDIAKSNQLRSLAVQDDGKIIAGGSSYLYFVRDEEFNQIFNFNYTLLRLFPNGTIDSSFGENGTVQADFGGIEEAYTVAIQTDGKILVGGSTGALPPGQNSPKFLLVRYLSNGQVDSSFGIDGRVTTIFNNSTDDIIKKILLLSDGGIIVCGTINGATGIFDSGDFALAKYLPNGDLDESFGVGGKVTTRMNSTGSLIRDAVLLKDGKILTAGVTNNGNDAKKRAVLVQYNPDGSLDASFGNGGKQEITFTEGATTATSLALQENGKIVFGVYISISNMPNTFGIVRCKQDGSLDSSFGANGKIVGEAEFERYPTEILLQNDGKIIVTGWDYETFRGISPFAARYYGDPTHPIFSKIRRWIHRNILNFSDANGTASQYNIEQQNSGGGFSTIASLLPNKNNSYSYNISNYTSATANSNFRIKAVYADGSTVYSDIVSEAALQTSRKPSIYPNPAASVITINGLDKNKNYNIIISNKEAQPLLQTAAKSVAQKQIDIAMLKAGIYFIELKDDVGGVVRLKLVKE